MINMTVSLVAIPEEACVADRLDLRILMSRAIKIEARMKKKVNLEDEQRRYLILCERMENLGSLISAEKQLESIDLGSEYLEILELMQKKFSEEAQKARLMANFCPVDMIEGQIKLFENLAQKSGFGERTEVKKKIVFYKKALKNRYHILELQDPSFQDAGVDGEDYEKVLNEFLAIPVRDEISLDRDSNSFVALRKQIKSVIADKEKEIPSGVNFSDISHNVITEILHEFVYGIGKPMYLPIVYGDGSKARPFPIHYLKKPEKGKTVKPETPILNVGMMSGRHPEMDPKMKIYFYRNQEISTGKTAAETDETAYQKAKAVFMQLRAEGIYKIAYFQTGFQPAVVGFYRALAEEIYSRGKSAPTLEVTPYYFFGENYEAGQTWI